MKITKKVCLFLTITFSISYAMAAVYYLIRRDAADRIGFTIMAASYMFVPFISVLITKKIHKERLFSNLLISFRINRWFFVAWFIFPVIVLCAIGISVLFPGITFNPAMTGLLSRFEGVLSPEIFEEVARQMNSLPANFVLISILQGFIAGISVNAVAGFGEETGWRGFLLTELKEMSFFGSSLVIGSIWGIWHAPLILMGHNYPQHRVIGVFMMVIWCILLTPVMQYITIKAKSVIPAAIAHGTLNAFSGFTIMAVNGGNDLTTGMSGLPGFAALIFFIAVLFIFDYYFTKEKIMLNKISLRL